MWALHELQVSSTKKQKSCTHSRSIHDFGGKGVVPNGPFFWPKQLGQKSCRTKFPRIFRVFVPNPPNFAPNFPEFFEEFSCFVWLETETRKNSPKIPAFFQCKIPRQTRKRNPQMFLESRHSNKQFRNVLSSPYKQLDRQNGAIVIELSLARMIAAIRITSSPRRP